MTNECLLLSMSRLARNVTHGTPPVEQQQELAADWAVILAGLDDATMTRAVAAYLADPERGRYWPSPADIIAAAGAIAPPTPARLAEATWDRMIQRIASGGQTVGDLLTPTERAALDVIGGTWALRRAEEGVQLASLRRRWLDHIATAEQTKVLRLVTTEDRAVTDRLRGLLGTGADEHAGQRARAIAQGRGE
jgi:hypothetical protein